MTTPTPEPARAEPVGGIYIASKAIHGPRWREWRDAGHPIISTWIDEAEAGRTTDWGDLWDRCVSEASRAAVTIVYREDGEELKGARVEVGAALAHGRHVIVVGDIRDSWTKHANVTRIESFNVATSYAGLLIRRPAPAPASGAGLAEVERENSLGFRLKMHAAANRAFASRWDATDPAEIEKRDNAEKNADRHEAALLSAFAIQAATIATLRADNDRLRADAAGRGEGMETDAARDVLAERRRQVEAEGWTPEHDDQHASGEMADAAASYALRAHAGQKVNLRPPGSWPWETGWWKPGKSYRNLVKAGALILAELDRLNRARIAAAPAPATDGTGGGHHG